MTITEQEQKAIREYFKGRNIPKGLGDENSACSIGGINLALYGQLDDITPECMSEQIGHWIVRVQDAMTDDIRNSDRWRELLPRAAGTGREHEQVRSSMILEWMWETVLPYLQPIADEDGYGDAWRAMCQERTADAAAKAADMAANAAPLAARTEVDAARAATQAGYAAAYTANAGYVAGAPHAAYAAAYAAKAVKAYAASAAYAKAWEHFDPCTLLARLIAVSETERGNEAK
ncbi:unnamed protein product [Sphagnum jensenii]|uniref:Uncharacterized protein n=1 Tax=Sphagnum jensenii TaxID=128206 RepID=A0ABP0V6H7_9BRYO